MRHDLPHAELDEFLALPLVAVLATYRRDGGVLLSPVWHRWRDGGFDVVTGPDDVKARHLARDPRASLLVYDQAPPYRGVELTTEARVLAGHGAATARDIAVRYLGAEAGEEYAAGAGEQVVIRLEPGRLRSWDFADEF